MFFLPFALSFASVLASPRYKRASELVVELSGPSGSVNSADLVLTASITNTGGQDVKVLKYGTVLDDLPTRSFVVSNDDTQSEVPFTGVKVELLLVCILRHLIVFTSCTSYPCPWTITQRQPTLLSQVVRPLMSPMMVIL